MSERDDDMTEQEISDLAWGMAVGQRNDPAPVPSEVEAALDVYELCAELLACAKGEGANDPDELAIAIGAELRTLTAECQRLRAERDVVVDVAGRIVEDTIAANTDLANHANVLGISLAEAVKRRILLHLATLAGDTDAR